MMKALIVAAGLALTSYPVLAQEQGTRPNGDQQSYDQDQDQGDGAQARPRWHGEDARDDDQVGWRYGGRNWRRSEDDGDRWGAGQRRRMGGRGRGAAFRLEGDGMKLSVRCGEQETLHDCMSAAVDLLRAAHARQGQAPAAAPVDGPQPATPTPKQP